MKYEIALETGRRERTEFVLYETLMWPTPSGDVKVRRRVGGDNCWFDSEPEARAALEIWVQLRIHHKLGLVSGVFKFGLLPRSEVETVKWDPDNTFQSTTIRPVNDGAMGAYVAGLIEEPF